MLSRSALGRHTQRAARRSWQQQNRGLAAPASGSFTYESGDAQGIKFASRDIPGPVSSLAIVAKAGTRYQAFPGLTEALQLYAFKVRQIGMGRDDEDGDMEKESGADGHFMTEHREEIYSEDTARV